MERKASRSEPLVKRIVKATFPEYRGRKIKIKTTFPPDLISYWSGGSISYFVFYQPDSDKTFPVNSLESPWKQYKQGRKFSEEMIPLSVVLVEHRFFCGHDMGITIYVREPSFLKLEDQIKMVTEEKE